MQRLGLARILGVIGDPYNALFADAERAIQDVINIYSLIPGVLHQTTGTGYLRLS